MKAGTFIVWGGVVSMWVLGFYSGRYTAEPEGLTAREVVDQVNACDGSMAWTLQEKTNDVIVEGICYHPGKVDDPDAINAAPRP